MVFVWEIGGVGIKYGKCKVCLCVCPYSAIESSIAYYNKMYYIMCVFYPEKIWNQKILGLNSGQDYMSCWPNGKASDYDLLFQRNLHFCYTPPNPEFYLPALVTQLPQLCHVTCHIHVLSLLLLTYVHTDIVNTHQHPKLEIHNKNTNNYMTWLFTF